MFKPNKTTNPSEDQQKVICSYGIAKILNSPEFKQFKKFTSNSTSNKKDERLQANGVKHIVEAFESKIIDIKNIINNIEKTIATYKQDVIKNDPKSNASSLLEKIEQMLNQTITWNLLKENNYRANLKIILDSKEFKQLQGLQEPKVQPIINAFNTATNPNIRFIIYMITKAIDEYQGNVYPSSEKIKKTNDLLKNIESMLHEDCLQKEPLLKYNCI